jgi:hypothetical protein
MVVMVTPEFSRVVVMFAAVLAGGEVGMDAG